MSQVAISGNASGTGTLTIAAPNTNSDYTLTLPQATTTFVGTDATQTLTNKTIQGGAITSGTAVASTSGTSIDFTSIPSWVKRITVMLNGVSTSGTSILLAQLGDSGGIETTGYNSCIFTNGAQTNSTAGFQLQFTGNAAFALSGHIVFTLLDASTNNWIGSGTIAGTTSNNTVSSVAGQKATSSTLDRVRITTTNGTDTFDGGSINILYEG
jgi:hypothetical protein